MTGIRAPVPDPLDAFDGSTFLRNAVLFTRALRSAGVVTDLGGALDFARALTFVDIGDRSQVHAAGSAVFCRRRADLETYDAGLRPVLAPPHGAHRPNRARGRHPAPAQAAARP